MAKSSAVEWGPESDGKRKLLSRGSIASRTSVDRGRPIAAPVGKRVLPVVIARILGMMENEKKDYERSLK